jgi:hypothetical protein
MAPESRNVRASLTRNGFQRKSFSFINWNTKSNGSGTRYDNGGNYKFGKSVTLYARWRHRRHI